MPDTQPAIKIAENGPYVVTDVTLRGKTPILSDDGEPIAWRTGEDVDTRSRYSLCRCGASSNKPLCDGTHAKIGFDGTETVSGTYSERAKDYQGHDIVVHDDRSICVHAGFCGNEVTNVWKMVNRTDDINVRSEMIAMIERCPSGALTYSIDSEVNEPDLPEAISVIPDGPLWVTNGVTVTCSDGSILEERNRVTLCRCGQSANKPLCDGSHAEAGFKG